MNTLIVCAALTVLAVTCQGATTVKPHNTHASHHTHVHHSHATREPNVGVNFSFYYLPITHNLLIRNGPDCYVATLTADELSKVHTDMGMKTIELRLLGQLSAATATTNATLHASEVKHCGKHATNFYTLS